MLNTFFDINNVAFEAIGYTVSNVELIGTIFGFISVYFASRANILTWSTGIINELFLFILFFQIQLYADMFLQLYFFIVTIYGWHSWKQNPKLHNITTTTFKTKIWILGVIFIATIVFGLLISRIHLFLPQFFKTPSSFPYTDSFIMVLSVSATILLARKKVETWYLWILVDLICVFLFFEKGIVFLAVEYLLFLGMATYGLMNWKKQINNG